MEAPRPLDEAGREPRTAAAEAHHQVGGSLNLDSFAHTDAAADQCTAGDQADVPTEAEQEQTDEDQRTVIAGQHRARSTRSQHDPGHHHGAFGADALDETPDP